MEDRSPKPAAGKGRRSLIDACSGTVDSWLSADRLMPRKQRHTARRVYARLVEEEGFEGSYLSVQRYVRRWREEHRSDGDGYLELDWSTGVMQVDFGEAVATIGGGDVKVHCGRHVPALEHAVRGRDAGRERGMRVRGAGPDLRPHRHGSPRAGARQRHRCGPPRRVEQGDSGARVRHVLRPLPARDEVPRPRIPATRRARSRTRSASCAATSWSPSPTRRVTDSRRGICRRGATRSRTWTTTVPAGRYASCSTRSAGRCSRCRARFDAVEWVGRKADREGNVQIGSVRYLAGLRAFEVEIRTADGRHVNTLPRSYGDGGRTAGNPATLLPALARKPNAWNGSPLRGELPDGLAAHLDALDPRARRLELTMLHRASLASGFGNAVLAMAAIVEGGRTPDEASLLALARRIAQGDPPDPDDGAGRLAVYDAFNNPDGKGAES